MTNCLLYALSRLFREGGYIIARKSHYGWWPHFLWSRDLQTFEQYAPSRPNHHKPVPPLVFHGQVKKHKADDKP